MKLIETKKKANYGYERTILTISFSQMLCVYFQQGLD